MVSYFCHRVNDLAQVEAFYLPNLSILGMELLAKTARFVVVGDRYVQIVFLPQRSEPVSERVLHVGYKDWPSCTPKAATACSWQKPEHTCRCNAFYQRTKDTDIPCHFFQDTFGNRLCIGFRCAPSESE